MTRDRSRRTRRARATSEFRHRNRQVFHIPAEWLSDAKAGLEEVLSRLRLSLGSGRPLTGSRRLSTNTSQAYKKHYRGLRYFCCMIGDYESLLMLQDDAPNNFCPSMSSSTLSNFIRFKRGKSESLLFDANGERVLDRKGLPVFCQGGWKDPDNVAQLISAVSALHSARGQRGQYFDKCNVCWEAYHQDNLPNGCFHHLGSPLFWRTGDPSLSDLVENTKRASTMDSVGYLAKGNFALMINELIAIRQRLISSGSLYDYGIWVMILLGVHLFLRSEEMVELRIEDFILDLTAFDELGRADQLVVQVHGKSEKAQAKGPVILVLWRLDSHPNLCPLRSLFLYTARSGIKYGYLFGPKSVINRADLQPGALESVGSHLSYDEFNSIFFELCNAVTGDENRNRYGTHTIRKTAYLYAIWGGGDLDHIRQGARHKTLKNAQLYYRDSKALLARARRTGSHILNLAPAWQPIYLENLQAARRIAIDGSCPRSSSQSIPNLASSYVAECLKVDIRSTALFQLISMTERDIPKASAFDQLQTLLSNQAPELAEKITALVNEIVYQRIGHQLDTEPVQFEAVPRACAPCDTVEPLPFSAENPVIDPMQQPAKRGGTNNLERRLELSSLESTGAKIALLEEIEQAVPESKSELTEGGRQFVNQIMAPILFCYRQHYHSDIELFTGKWGSCLSHSKFSKLCSKKHPCIDSIVQQ